MVKIPTQWFNPNRNGSWSLGSNNDLITNSGSFIVDNSNDYIVTNLGIVTPEPASSWTQSVKSAMSWNANLASTPNYNISDQSSNLIIYENGNFVMSGNRTYNPVVKTSWSQV